MIEGPIEDWLEPDRGQGRRGGDAKQVLWALKESARQGFWNGSLPPISAAAAT
jgi:hypothetical protein